MGDLFPSNEPPFRMSRACPTCGGCEGRIRPTNGQNVVDCIGCGRKGIYNAPKTETGQRTRSVSTVHEAISPKKRARVLERATGRCELCGRGDGAVLHVGHLLSVVRGVAEGLTEVELNDEENLCAMCEECNLGIGRNVVPLRLVIAISMARLRRGAPA